MQAVAWYEQAAKQGNEKAKENLNDLLNPEITDEEYEEAITDEYGAKYTKGGLKLISVPEGLKSYTIKEGTRVICIEAFRGCKSLQSVVIPDGVTEIGSSAFYGCSSLQSVVIPDGVTYIGDYAFSGCTSLQSVVIPDSVTEIGRNTFADCSSLQPVVIPDGVTYIEIEDDLPF